MGRKDTPGQVDFEGKVAPPAPAKVKAKPIKGPIPQKFRRFNLASNGLVLDDNWTEIPHGHSPEQPLTKPRKPTPEELYAFNIDTRKKNKRKAR